ncbi:MAG TPA: four helix bundle protein, partial [Gemmatimonadaceae bacterium]|nr:four helix bundle protein [Gemmatimonadaceae bacterium]
HALTLRVHDTMQGARRGMFAGLRPQILRSAASVPANIAEGCGKPTRDDFLRYLSNACGSLAELESHLELARDLRAIDRPHHEEIVELLTEVRRMLLAMIRTLRSRPDPKRGGRAEAAASTKRTVPEPEAS